MLSPVRLLSVTFGRVKPRVAIEPAGRRRRSPGRPALACGKRRRPSARRREATPSRPALTARSEAESRSLVNANTTIRGPMDSLDAYSRSTSGARDDRTHATAARPRDGRRRTAVMADVAKLAGRVAPDGLARDQRQHARAARRPSERVLAAMRQLDYRPNPAARALVTGRSGTLGVVSFDTTLYGPGLDAVRDRAGRARGGLLHHHRQPARPRPELRAGSAVERLRVQGVDGILVITPQEGAADALVNLPAGVPLVAVEAGRRQLGPAGRRRPVRRRGRTRRSCCSTSATRPSGTSRGRASSSRPSSASTAGAPRSRRPARRFRAVLVGDWSPALGLPGSACSWPAISR